MARNKELWMALVDLEKAFDRVPREVVWWALRCLGVDEWIVTVIKVMYEDATTTVRVNGRESKAFIIIIIIIKCFSKNVSKAASSSQDKVKL